jgi:hypothetical protein
MKNIIESVKDCAFVKRGSEENGHDCWGKTEWSYYKYVDINNKKHIVSDGWYIEHDGKNVLKIHYSILENQHENSIVSEFIPYNEAFDLKELGFDEPCLGKYSYNDIDGPRLWWPMGGYCNRQMEDGDITAPLYSQAFKYIREKYDLNASVDKSLRGYFAYIQARSKTSSLYNNTWINTDENPLSYEEAQLASLQKLIEIAQNEKIN